MMKINGLALIVLLSVAFSACGQQRWSSSLGGNKISGGSVLSLQYHAPSDSGKIHVAFVSLDSSLCYRGYGSKDRFPPSKKFDLQILWGKCGEKSNISTDSLSVEYNGRWKQISFINTPKKVSYGDLFLVINSGIDTSNTTFRRIRTMQDLNGLPVASKKDLRAFIQDSLNWAGQHQ